MDPLTQGAVGAALPLATRHRRQATAAAALGFLAGMAADLDVLIRDPDDTLLFLEYHRHFTHALVFIPIGSAAVAGLLYILFGRWMTLGFLKMWLFCALGYATHGVLDAATSYGTFLFWPFDDTRYSLNIISVVDPLFTLPVLTLVAIGTIRKRGGWGRAALLWAVLYLSAAAYQHSSALSMGQALAANRGHVPDRILVKPTFGNIVLWKSVYETQDRFHVDAVRPWPSPAVFAGASARKLDLARDFPWLDRRSQQARDIERFSRFSDNFVAGATDGSNRVVDVRYSLLPTQISALWSLALDPDAPADAHAVYQTHRANAREALPVLLQMIFGRP